jgi:nucleotide-binding universal stress UspA family protein
MNSVQSPMIASESAPAIENIGEIIAVAEASAEKNLERLRTRLAKAGVPSDTRQSTGAPVANILKEAGELKAHYIVMGSHGHTAFYDLLVGSTTQGVLKKAPCPVLIVPAEKAKRRKT